METTKKHVDGLRWDIEEAFQKLRDFRKELLLAKRFNNPTQNEIKQIDRAIKYIEKEWVDVVERWKASMEAELKRDYREED